MISKKEQFLNFCGDNRPTKEQQKAIFGRYSVVAAGAGSGKTATLSQRFLWLVMNGIPADQILTITFTKDAASSMKGKIFKTLQDAVNQKLISEDDLKPFSKSTICTTDSFCSEIAKMECVKYGIPANFQIEDSSELEAISSQIVDQVLEANKGTQLDDYLSFYSIENIKETMLVLAMNHINIASPIDTENIKNEITSVIYSDDEKEKRISLLKKQLQDYLENRDFTHNEDDDKAIETFFNNYRQDLEFSLNTLKKNLPNTRGSKEDKLKCNPLKTKIKKTIQNILICLVATEEENLNRLNFICQLIDSYQNKLIKHKRETGLVTFHDVMKMSLDILMKNETVRSFYNEKFKAIMVDEFQDNNEDNKNLIYLLATKDNYKNATIPDKDVINKEKIFMVGDEKQSIYKFRNADVSVFKGISKDLSICPLTQNFRSEKEIIGTVNSLFSNIMENAEKSYEAVFQKLHSKNSHVKPSISFQYLIEQNSTPEGCLTSLESEAYAVARKIKEIVEINPEPYRVYKSKKLVNPTYSDIAILLKVGTHQGNYEKALRFYDIPFDASESKTLTMDAVLNDFYTVLQLAVYGPEDEISKYAYLKGPFCRLSDKQIFENRDNVYYENNKIINLLHAYITGHNLSQVVSYIWNELGYRCYVLSNGNNQSFEEHYDYVFKLACRFDAGNKTLVDFLNYIRPMLGKESKIKDLAIQKEEACGVKIMSIHKSKGLEFPIVFVADMQSGSSSPGGFSPKIKLSDSNTVILPYCQSGDKLINPLDEESNDDKRMENAETKRVLYVAATRAQDHLIFSGVIPPIPLFKDNEKEEKISEKLQKYQHPDEDNSNLSQLDYFLKAIDFTYGKTQEETSLSFHVSTKKDEEQPEFYFEPFDMKMEKFDYQPITGPINKEEKHISKDLFKEAQPQQILFTRPVVSVTKDEYSNNDGPITEELEIDKEIENRKKEFGDLVHKLIENEINNNPIEVSGYFEDHKSKDSIYDCAMRLKNRFISGEFFTYLKDHYRLFAEEPIMINDKGQLKNGIIDLLCVNNDEIVIVDYKTDIRFNPDKHKEQLGVYKKASEYIFKRPVKTYLYYLRSGKETQI